MNTESILRNAVSYEDWILERLQDRQEAVLYLEAALEVFQEDGDYDLFLFAVRCVAIAQDLTSQHPTLTTVGRHPSEVSFANWPEADDSPGYHLDGWPRTQMEKTQHFWDQSGAFSPHSHLLVLPRQIEMGNEDWFVCGEADPRHRRAPKQIVWGGEDWDTKDSHVLEMHRAPAEFCFEINSWVRSILERD